MVIDEKQDSLRNISQFIHTLARCSTICEYPRSVIWTLSLAIIQLSPSLGVYTTESRENSVTREVKNMTMVKNNCTRCKVLNARFYSVVINNDGMTNTSRCLSKIKQQQYSFSSNYSYPNFTMWVRRNRRSSGFSFGSEFARYGCSVHAHCFPPFIFSKTPKGKISCFCIVQDYAGVLLSIP